MEQNPSEAPAPIRASTLCFGFLCHKPSWRLTRRGWLAAAVLALVCVAILIRSIHPFLAVSDPVPGEVLVVEGWVPDYALEEATDIFRAGKYQRIYVTGGPIERGAPLAEYKNYAALGAAVLCHYGVATNQVRAIPAPQVRRDRTYASALEVRDWFAAHEEMPVALNVVTLGLHARRSRLLYEDAFGGACRIGVISVEEQDYEPRHWWSYSQGVRSVMSETVAYLYVRLFFSFSAERRVENK